MAWVYVRRCRASRDAFNRIIKSACEVQFSSSCSTRRYTPLPLPAYAGVPRYGTAALVAASPLAALRHVANSAYRLQPEPPAPQQQKTTLTSLQNTGGWTFDEVVNVPNALSMGRLLSGPLIAYWVVEGEWSLALPGLAASGVSDWLDGYFARRGGRHSVLGSYLDPLADKVLVGSVVASLGYSGALPLPLVGVIVGRDVVLVGGAFLLRAQSLGWKWPGARNFFRIAYQADGSPSDAVHAAPFIRPLLISKINTGLQIALVASCMSQAWVGWPGMDSVWGFGAATFITTLWSTAAYAKAYLRGELLLVDKYTKTRRGK